MKTLNLNVTLNQGTDFNIVLQIPGVGTNPPPDITDYTFESQMRETSDESSPIIAQFDFEILNQTTNTGQVRWFLPSATTEEIVASIIAAYPLCRTPTPYVFDILMTDSLGTITRIVQGVIEVSPTVTRPL